MKYRLEDTTFPRFRARVADVPVQFAAPVTASEAFSVRGDTGIAAYAPGA
jgi:hypothetical protein